MHNIITYYKYTVYLVIGEPRIRHVTYIHARICVIRQQIFDFKTEATGARGI